MTLPRSAFERGVRRLDGPTACAFVADLLCARGFRTTVEGEVVTATDDARGSMRVLVVADARSLAAVGRARSVDAVVLTGGTVTVAVGSLAVRAAGREDRPAVLDAETLYEWFVYAVDAEARAALEDRYLGSTEPSAPARVGVAVADALSDWADRPSRSGGTGGRTAVVLVALLALVAAVAAGPLGAFGPGATSLAPAVGDDAGETPGRSAVSPTVTPPPTTARSGGALPDVCPPPPTGAHPASLRPVVRQTATAAGLDGWHVLVTQNLSEYRFDPNDQQAELVPLMRHVAVFERPGGAQFRLGLDRWESATRAESALARGGAWGFGLAWGAYVAWVEWDSGDTGGDVAARHLLAAVRTPEGTKLGAACVSALVSGDEANGSG